MTYSVCKIKNISGASLDLRRMFDVDEVYVIPDNERLAWINDSNVFSAINDEKIQIGDEDSFLTSYAEQYQYLASILSKNVVVESTTPFANPEYRTKGDATGVILINPNENKAIDFQLTEERYIIGGSLIGKNCLFGDYFVAQIYDKDGVIPEAYRAAICEDYPVVAEYYNKRYLKIIEGGITVHKIDTKPLAARITAGLYLRIVYCATDEGSARQVVINYDLLKKI